MATGTIKKIVDMVEITSQVTFSENKAPNTHLYVIPQARMVVGYYQGEGKTHNANALIFTLPSQYKPISSYYFGFIKNANARGTLSISSSAGECRVSTITSTTASGRIYSNFIFLY